MSAPYVPMRADERPAEPGWYVARWYGRLPTIVQVETGRDGLCIRQETNRLYLAEADGIEFVARLFPERVEPAV